MNLSIFLNVNTPRFSRQAAALLAFGLMTFPCASLHARVGETQDAIEKRILQPGVGKLYPRVGDSTTKDKEKDRFKKREDDPLKDVRLFLPGDTREVLYWKSAVAHQLSGDNGWKIDVFYLGGRSVLEAYKRVGDSLSEFEVRGLLSIHRGNSSWKKNSSDGGGVNGIGYDYVLDDDSLRAKEDGNWIIIFSTNLDNAVMQQQQIAKTQSDQLKEQQKRDQALKAPESISGF